MLTVPDAKEFVPFLGRTDADPLLNEFLRQLGPIDRAPRRDDDYAGCVDILPLGVSLFFLDEELFDGMPQLNEGAYVLTSVSLYSGEVCGYSKYNGALTYGLRFSDTRDIARTKIGIQPKSKEPAMLFGAPQMAWDRFKLSEYDLGLTYCTNWSIAKFTMSTKMQFRGTVED